MRRFFHFPLIFPAVLALLACATSNQAVVPGPLAEIPSEFSVPDNVGVDVSGAGSVSATSSVSLIQTKALVGSSGEFSDAIAFGPDAVTEFNSFIGEVLATFAPSPIPVDPTVKNFKEIIIDPINPDIPIATIKIDFSDFDYDGDPEGKPDGFSGCTCPVGCAPDLPVCPREAPISELRRVGFRFWVQKAPDRPFKRLMAGFFNFLPVLDDPITPQNEENSGKGEIRINFAALDDSDDGTREVGSKPRFIIVINFDQQDPASELNKTAEVFSLADLLGETGEFTGQQRTHFFSTQIQKMDLQDKKYLEKTVKVNDQRTEGNSETFKEIYSGRFRDDADFWSGSFVHEEIGLDPILIPTTCARISTGDGLLLPDVCLDLNIDTSNEDVTKGQGLRSTTEADVRFPTDFPPTPNF